MSLGQSIAVLRKWAKQFEIILPEKNEDLLELESLEHNGGYVSYIPKEIVVLKKIKKMIFKDNCIQEIPPLPESLVFLSLEGNMVSSFNPSFFENAHSLKFLFLRKNKISSLPYAFYRLSSLSVLDLSYNALSSVNVVFRLPNLSILNLEGNSRIASFKIDAPIALSKLNISKTGIEEFTQKNFSNLYVDVLLAKKVTIRRVDYSFFSSFSQAKFVARENHESVLSYLIYRFFSIREKMRFYLVALGRAK